MSQTRILSFLHFFGIFFVGIKRVYEQNVELRDANSEKLETIARPPHNPPCHVVYNYLVYVYSKLVVLNIHLNYKECFKILVLVKISMINSKHIYLIQDHWTVST